MTLVIPFTTRPAYDDGGPLLNPSIDALIAATTAYSLALRAVDATYPVNVLTRGVPRPGFLITGDRNCLMRMRSVPHQVQGIPVYRQLLRRYDPLNEEDARALTELYLSDLRPDSAFV